MFVLPGYFTKQWLLEVRMEKAAEIVDRNLPDMMLVSPDQAAELHAMIPGFKSWPVG